MDALGVGAVADLAKVAINKIWPDKSDQEKQELAAAVMVVQGQLEINKEEAVNPSLFVSGWRPFIGWVCGMACAWNWIGISVMKTTAALLHFQVALNPADLSEMFPVLIGMLGLGGLRTMEKFKNVAAK